MSPIRVLHLEDSPRDAEMIRHRLEVADIVCDILLASSKDTFEGALTRESFDLIISDYNLPGYDGLTALKYALLTQPDVPVILISGTVDEEQAVNCLHIGATDYLLKDRLDRLGPAVQRALLDAETRVTRKRADAALVVSAARRAAILDSVLDCIVTMDEHGNVIEFNIAASRTFGYTRDEAMGRPVAELIIPPRFRERHRAGLAHYLATGEGPIIGKVIEIVAMRSDGTELPVELAITAIRSGSTSIFTGVLRDITARTQAADAALRSQKHLRDLIDGLGPSMFVGLMTPDGIMLEINQAPLLATGLTPDDVIGKPFVDTPWWAHSAEIRQHLRDAITRGARGEASRFDLRAHGVGTEVIDIDFSLQPLRDAAGQVTFLIPSASVITERKQAEESLRTAEERMRFTLESSNVGIWDMDFTTGVLQWSDTMAVQYGVVPGTFEGTFDGFANRIHPDDRASTIETIGKAVASGADFSVTHRALWHDGTVRWLNGAGRVFLDSSGTPLRGIGISQDITERRILEAHYQQAQKMEAVGRLAGGVAHDFNNLLNVILGFSELLLEDLTLGESRKADITEIQKAGVRAAGLTRQLLTFSRKEIIQPTVLDLNVVVADMRVMLGRLIGEDVEVVLGLGRAVAPVKADRGQLEQIVLNLAVNARDAMPKGGRLTIGTANVEPDECSMKANFSGTPRPCVALTITDTGTGMTPEVKARLFEPFFTTKGVGKGTGLGLATVHGIVARTGGSITVDSELGKGTSFTVHFPMADPAEQVVAAPAHVARAAAGVQTVLVVEDAAGLREVTRRLLERLGYSVLVAANADEARALFEQNPSIDLLLTDVVMPGASGPELVVQLMERRPTLKVIYMSGYTDEAIVHHGILDSGVAFLQKPFSSETLGRTLREAFDR